MEQKIRCRYCDHWFVPKKRSFFQRIVSTDPPDTINCPRCNMKIGRIGKL